jgi:arylsulfatase A-like enzyme
MKSHKLIHQTVALIALCVACSVSAKSGDIQNVLMIAVDDLKPFLRCYGDSIAKTPNIDRLASEGTVFLNAHCQQAVCGPTRASLMTGLRPDKTGVKDLQTKMRESNPDLTSLPEHLQEYGFSTAGTGKIYDPRCVDKKCDEPSWSVPFRREFRLEFPDGVEKPVLGAYQSAKAHALLAEAEAAGISGYGKTKKFFTDRGFWPGVECVDVSDEAYVDAAIAADGRRLMQQFEKEGEPFFLAVGFKKPHLPFVAPKKYWDLYDREEFQIHPFQKKAKNGVDLAYHSSPELGSYLDIPSFNSFSDVESDRMPEAKQKELLHGYYACISYIDALVGTLLNELDELGLKENTAIVFWGDHGWHFGDHGLWCKHSTFEQATRSPLIFTAPGFLGGRTTQAPVEFVDIFPTVCDLLGVKALPTLDGVSLTPLMDGSSESVKEFAMSLWPKGAKATGYALRDERYRYVEWIQGGDSTEDYDEDDVVGRELYDYKNDPMETVNLADSPEYKDVARKMNLRMRNFFREQTK